MKKIEPYNDVWLDCYNNLKVSLLRYINEENVVRGFNNNYKYNILPFSFEGSKEFYCISEEQYIIDYKEFAEVTKINPTSQEEFYEIIKEQLKNKNGFVLMRTDLFDWLEGNICWQRYHWDHYSLLVDYDEINKQFTVFDEKGGNYVQFFVPESKLYQCIFHTDKFEILRLITLTKDKVELQSIDEIKKNAIEIIESIDNCLKYDFWNMENYIYDGGHYKDLNGIYLQKIEGRHKANSKLMTWLNAGNEKGDYIKFQNAFDELATEWSKIRMALFILYVKRNNREKKIQELNQKMKDCLLTEKEIWNEVINN